MLQLEQIDFTPLCLLHFWASSIDGVGGGYDRRIVEKTAVILVSSNTHKYGILENVLF